MEWQDEGIILGHRPCQENGLIVLVFTQNHGLCRGYMRRPHKAGGYHTGDWVRVRWRARLSEQLGFWTIELIQSHVGFFIASPPRMGLLQVIASMTAQTLPVGHPYALLYQHMLSCLQTWISPLSESELLVSYLALETTFLSHVGYGDFPSSGFSECSTIEAHYAYITALLNRHIFSEQKSSPQELRHMILEKMLRSCVESDTYS